MFWEPVIRGSLSHGAYNDQTSAESEIALAVLGPLSWLIGSWGVAPG